MLISACDTFRSGAVEQLHVHAQRLARMSQKPVELFERGYRTDPTGIAQDAIRHAKQKGFDVVLIDTAGRMQGNEQLMHALSRVTLHSAVVYFSVGEYGPTGFGTFCWGGSCW